MVVIVDLFGYRLENIYYYIIVIISKINDLLL